MREQRVLPEPQEPEREQQVLPEPQEPVRGQQDLLRCPEVSLPEPESVPNRQDAGDAGSARYGFHRRRKRHPELEQLR